MRLTRDDIIAGLTDLALRCSEAGIEGGIHVVGGAAISLEYDPSREATRDIDAWTNISHNRREDFSATVALVAQQHQWPRDWLNDAAGTAKRETSGPRSHRRAAPRSDGSAPPSSPRLRTWDHRRDRPNEVHARNVAAIHVIDETLVSLMSDISG